MTRPVTRGPLRRLLSYARAHRPKLALAAACSLLNRLFDLAPPALIGVAIDVVVRREGSFVASLGITDTEHQLLALAAITAVIWVLESVFEYLAKLLWRNQAQVLQHELRLDAYRHLQRLEMRYFEDRSTGGMMTVLGDDINQLERFLDGGADELIKLATSVTVIGISFLSFDLTLGTLAFVPIPLILWGSFYFQRRLTPLYADVRERAALLNAQLANNLGGMPVIKSFTAEEHEARRIAALSDDYQASNRRAIRLSSAFSPLIRMVILAGFTAILLRGGFLTLDGQLEAGSYGFLVFITQRLLWPMTRLGETFDLFQRAMASTRRVLDLLDTEPAIESGPRRLEPGGVRGAVSFESVSFRYGHGPQVLANLDLEAPAGETTAIVGSTGSGKSTIVKLVLRFYEPQAGRVLLDDVPIAELDLESLRAAIGLVSQDVFLFHGSIAENIAYGRRDATPDEIVAAAKSAEIHDFVTSLPDGYDTIVGERGQKLSGGQRQRVSLARAILKDPPILVLDEATSAVDNETEAAIQRSLERLAVGRTTIVIAHRLSTVRNAHSIHVIENGSVVERGRHEELVESGGAYAALWRVQTGVATSVG